MTAGESIEMVRAVTFENEWHRQYARALEAQGVPLSREGAEACKVPYTGDNRHAIAEASVDLETCARVAEAAAEGARKKMSLSE